MLRCCCSRRALLVPDSVRPYHTTQVLRSTSHKGKEKASDASPSTAEASDQPHPDRIPLPKDFNTYVRVLSSALYGNFNSAGQKHRRRLQEQKHLHPHLQGQVPPLNTNLKPFPSARDLAEEYRNRRRSQRGYSSSASLQRHKGDAVASSLPDIAKFTEPRKLAVGQWVECRKFRDNATTGVIIQRYHHRSHETWLILTPRGSITLARAQQPFYVWPSFCPVSQIPGLGDLDLATLFSDQDSHPFKEDFVKSQADIRNFREGGEENPDTKNTDVMEFSQLFDEEVDMIDFELWQSKVSDPAERLKWSELIRKMRAFGLTIDASLKTAAHARLADLYDHCIVNVGRAGGKKITCYEAAERLWPEYAKVKPNPTIDDFKFLALAAFRHMMDSPIQYEVSRESAAGRAAFVPRSYAEVTELLIVREWCRLKHPAYSSFIAKARAKQATEFSKDDKLIIRVLLASFKAARFSDTSPYLPVLAAIVNAAYQRPEAVDLAGTELQSLTQDFLISIGVLTPWQNLVKLDDAMIPWRESIESGQKPPSDQIDSSPAYSAHPYADTADPSQLNQADPVQHIRREWRNARVYVIDSPDAQELDDGISLEEICTTSDQPEWWIRVHIADPTALIHPRHRLSTLSHLRQQTLYTAEQTFPMLPNGFTQEHALSLGGRQCNVMTFSLRVSDDGQVLDSVIEPGVVFDPIVTTYDAVDTLLGAPSFKTDIKQTSNTFVLTSRPDLLETIASKPPSKSKSSENWVTPESRQDLRKLSELTDAIARRATFASSSSSSSRTSSTKINWTLARASTHVHSTPILEGSTSALAIKQYTLSDLPLITTNVPGIGAELDNHEISNSPANRLVSTLMVAANRAVADFGIALDLPMPYLKQAPPTFDSDSQLTRIMQSRDPVTGAISSATAVQLPQLNASRIETTPGGHWALGIPETSGYVRATSPLRRYNDMVAHWLIKTALLDRGNTKAIDFLKSLITNESPSVTKRFASRMDLHWTFWNIKSAWENVAKNNASEAVQYLFNNLTAFCLQGARLSRYDLKVRTLCHIRELGVAANLYQEGKDGQHLYAPGDTLAVRIERIDLGMYPSMQISVRE